MSGEGDETFGEESTSGQADPAISDTEDEVPPDLPEVVRLQTTALDQLTRQIERFHERVEVYEERLKKTQDAYEAARRETAQSMWKPIIERLAHLHTLATASAASAHEEGAGEEFAFFAATVEDLLEMMDLVAVEAVPGLPQDSRQHQAVKATPTGDETQAGTIRRVLRHGFTFAGGDRTFLPARVEVYRYDPSLTAVEQSDATSDASN